MMIGWMIFIIDVGMHEVKTSLLWRGYTLFVCLFVCLSCLLIFSPIEKKT